MTYSRGFASLGILLLLVIGLAVLGGSAWWVNKHVPTELNQAQQTTSTPSTQDSVLVLTSFRPTNPIQATARYTDIEASSTTFLVCNSTDVCVDWPTTTATSSAGTFVTLHAPSAVVPGDYRVVAVNKITHHPFANTDDTFHIPSVEVIPDSPIALAVKLENMPGKSAPLLHFTIQGDLPTKIASSSWLVIEGAVDQKRWEQNFLSSYGYHTGTLDLSILPVGKEWGESGPGLLPGNYVLKIQNYEGDIYARAPFTIPQK